LLHLWLPHKKAETPMSEQERRAPGCVTKPPEHQCYEGCDLFSRWVPRERGNERPLTGQERIDDQLQQAVRDATRQEARERAKALGKKLRLSALLPEEWEIIKRTLWQASLDTARRGETERAELLDMLKGLRASLGEDPEAMRPCDPCSGSGRVEQGRSEADCWACGGSGRVPS
jgi:hypothetical protein